MSEADDRDECSKNGFKMSGQEGEICMEKIHLEQKPRTDDFAKVGGQTSNFSCIINFIYH